MFTGRNRFPFTASQWQELEHQALIFKYMVSGMPIPPDLLFTIKRSLDSSLSSNLILHQPQHIGWNCLEMGYGKKIDPEPGRCRRTDGKKWRCSKEAYPDSKYCEKHLHRGRNRSRKPVEGLSTSTSKPLSSITRNPNPFNPTSHSLSSFTSIASETHHHNHPCYSTSQHTNFLLESSPYSYAHKDYRSSYGDRMKEEVDEHAFFSEASGTMRSVSGSSVDDSWRQLAPLKMGSPNTHLKQRPSSDLRSGYSYLQLQSIGENSKKQKQDQYVRDDEPQKIMHHFFDEWPPKAKDSWVDSENKSTKTQLSISMPNSSHDFLMTHNDK